MFRCSTRLSAPFLQDPDKKHAETGFLRRDRGQMVPGATPPGLPLSARKSTLVVIPAGSGQKTRRD